MYRARSQSVAGDHVSPLEFLSLRAPRLDLHVVYLRRKLVSVGHGHDDHVPQFRRRRTRNRPKTYRSSRVLPVRTGRHGGSAEIVAMGDLYALVSQMEMRSATEMRPLLSPPARHLANMVSTGIFERGVDTIGGTTRKK